MREFDHSSADKRSRSREKDRDKKDKGDDRGDKLKISKKPKVGCDDIEEKSGTKGHHRKGRGYDREDRDRKERVQDNEKQKENEDVSREKDYDYDGDKNRNHDKQHGGYEKNRNNDRIRDSTASPKGKKENPSPRNQKSGNFEDKNAEKRSRDRDHLTRDGRKNSPEYSIKSKDSGNGGNKVGK